VTAKGPRAGVLGGPRRPATFGVARQRETDSEWSDRGFAVAARGAVHPAAMGSRRGCASPATDRARPSNSSRFRRRSRTDSDTAQVQERLDGAQTRLLIIADVNGTGLISPTAADLSGALSTIERTVGTNGAIEPDGTKVPDGGIIGPIRRRRERHNRTRTSRGRSPSSPSGRSWPPSPPGPRLSGTPPDSSTPRAVRPHLHMRAPHLQRVEPDLAAPLQRRLEMDPVAVQSLARVPGQEPRARQSQRAAARGQDDRRRRGHFASGRSLTGSGNTRSCDASSDQPLVEETKLRRLAVQQRHGYPVLIGRQVPVPPAT